MLKSFSLLLTIIAPFLFFGQEIITVQDAYSKGNISFSEVQKWKDGSAMSDQKADGIIYLKKNGKFYKRIYDGKLNVKWFGASGDGHKNDSEAVQKAFNYGESVFFPAGTYLLNAEVPKHIEIEGDSGNTVLKPFDPSRAVLVYKTKQPYWTYANSISKIWFRSDNHKGIAVAFGEDAVSKKAKEDEYCGNVVFRSVNFKGFEKAVYFPFGNIGDNFYDCSFRNNYYGIYSLDNKSGGDVMHAGNKYFYTCEFSSNKVAVYVHNRTDGFGGISFTNCIFQFNEVNAYLNTNNTYIPVSFTNTWNEKKNDTVPKTVAIDSWTGNENTRTAINSAAFVLDGSSSTYLFVGGRLNDLDILGKNITVNSYSSNFEYQEGVGAQKSNIGAGNIVNLYNPSTDQGIQQSANVVVKNGFTLTDNALKITPSNPEKRGSVTPNRKKAAANRESFNVLFNEPSSLTGSFNADSCVENNGSTLSQSNRAKINFTVVNQYLRFENTVKKVQKGYYLVSVDIKVNSGNPLFFVWDRNQNQMVRFVPQKDGLYHNYTGYGEFINNADTYLDVASEDGKPVDFNVSAYQLIKFSTLKELKDHLSKNIYLISNNEN